MGRWEVWEDGNLGNRPLTRSCQHGTLSDKGASDKRLGHNFRGEIAWKMHGGEIFLPKGSDFIRNKDHSDGLKQNYAKIISPSKHLRGKIKTNKQIMHDFTLLNRRKKCALVCMKCDAQVGEAQNGSAHNCKKEKISGARRSAKRKKREKMKRKAG
ncbi:hypothetical protein POVCU2_0030390 [Plasmodium ovale curtisi]|uniref:Uncharacterized protein n=1 Tax=Plasmodium ovale curtisi TaxID=864141 RepID=A0A1A8WPD0_PLAOA|nr:hypothetical protein POVCU2_0030390 [Plasmodium ovale curtisi]SBS94135.1 hypothetical protein POVCU1_027650 [Plasmodium ovale curtisi]